MSELVIQARRAKLLTTGARQAHVEVNKAVARGDLPAAATQTCADCGDPAAAYDHRDYSKPLDVEPVCNPCNALRGAALPDPAAQALYRNAILESEQGWKATAAKPVLLYDTELVHVRSYRDAVRLAWELRSSPNMTRATLAEKIGAFAPHVSDYFHRDDLPSRRNLPPELIDDFEWAVGNRAVTQYLMRKAGLTIMEEVIATRAAA